MSGAMNDVRTIFVGGLPRDCSERELHLLFYEGGGCEAIKLQHPPPDVDPHSRYGRSTAFVQFATRERALGAAGFVNGMVYDPSDPGSLLRVEMAKQDFKRLPGAAPAGQGPPPKRPRWGAPPAQPDPALAEKDASTLFIGSLGELVRKPEVEEFACSQDGLLAVTMKDEGTNKAVAWAQYATPDHAMVALSNLQAVPLPSLGRAPNLELARSNTGERAMLALSQNAAPPQQQVWNTPAPAQGGGSSTVFLGSIEPQVYEPELHAIAMTQEGFVRLTTKLGGPRGTAWLQFDSPATAAAACAALQRVPLPSMGRPANVELARSDIRGQ